MPSDAREKLAHSLADVHEIILGHVALTGGGKGRPKQRQGQAITRSAVVLLSAATEQFLEDLFEEAAPLVYPTATQDELDRLFGATTKRLNHPSLHKVTVMYFSIGMNHPFHAIRWRKMPNDRFRRKYNDLLETRGQIAHGRRPTVRLATLRSWTTTIEKFAERFETLVADHIERQGNARPTW